MRALTPKKSPRQPPLTDILTSQPEFAHTWRTLRPSAAETARPTRPGLWRNGRDRTCSERLRSTGGGLSLAEDLSVGWPIITWVQFPLSHSLRTGKSIQSFIHRDRDERIALT
jgi:hypothetical protein